MTNSPGFEDGKGREKGHSQRHDTISRLFYISTKTFSNDSFGLFSFHYTAR